MSVEDVKELLENPGFVSRSVGPKHMPLFCLVRFDDKAEQVIESAFGITLDVKIDPCGRHRKFWRAEDVDLFLSDGHRLQGWMMGRFGIFRSFAFSPGP